MPPFLSKLVYCQRSWGTAGREPYRGRFVTGLILLCGLQNWILGRFAVFLVVGLLLG